MVDPVQEQLDAYNSRDLAGFIRSYADDVVITRADGTALMSGHEEMRVHYGAMFGRPEVAHVEVVGRVRAGGWTVDHELLVAGEQTMEALVAYQVRDGRIDRVVMLR